MSESLYDRAVATWVARKINVNPDHVRKVDFDIESGYAYSSLTFEAGHASLTFEFFYPANYEFVAYRGVWGERSIDLDDLEVTPGEFIEQCVAILHEISRDPR